MKLIARTARWICLLCITSCGGSGDSYSLDTVIADANETTRRRMDVRWIEHVSSTDTADHQTDPDVFLGSTFATFCEGQAERGNSTLCDSTTTCANQICAVERDICIANRVLEIATQVGELSGEAFPTLSTKPITIPVQDIPTQYAMATQAYFYAARALQQSGTALETCGASYDTTWSGDTDLTVAQFLAASYGDSFDVATDAIDEIQRTTSAFSDEYRAQYSEAPEHATLALHGDISRGRTAAFLAGGTELALANVEEGFCPVAPPSSEARRAIDLIRIAAPDPEHLVAGGDIDDFVTADVVEPLATLLPDPAIADVTNAEELYATLGLTQSAFLSARTYLTAEYYAFDRSTAGAPPLTLPGGTTTETLFDRFAATSSAPLAPSRAFYQAVAAFAPAARFPYVAGPIPTVPFGGYKDLVLDGVLASPVAAPSYASLVDGYVTGARRLIRKGSFGIRDDETKAMLATLLVDADGLLAGRLEGCFYDFDTAGNDRRFFLRAHGPTVDPGQLMLVRGHAGLDCATRGHVDSAPCSIEDYKHGDGGTWSFTAHDETEQHSSGFDGYFQRTVALIGEPTTRVEDADLFFVVVRRPGTDGGAGDFEELGGFTVWHPPAGTAGWRYCEHFPIVPDAARRVTELLAPSPDNCAQQATSCAGVPFDQLIPLENELTSDGDGVESSWKHYLGLAQRAADHADALGEEVIRAGLEMDLRAEGAIDELENLCGVSLNVTTFGDLGTRPRTVPAVDDECPDGYRLEGRPGDMSQICVIDPIAMALSMAASDDDANRLTACLGADSTEAWATMGDRTVCVWEDDAGDLCGHATSDRPCPYPSVTLTAGGAATCADDADALPPEAGGVAITIDTTLGLFHHPSASDFGRNPARPGAMQFPCEEIAAARQSNLPIPSSPWLTPEHISEIASRISWAPSVGDYSSVLWDRGVLRSTGNVFTGPDTSGWPCVVPACVGIMTETQCDAVEGCAWNPGTEECNGVPRDPLCPASAFVSEINGSSGTYTGPLYCLSNVCGSPTDPYETMARYQRAQMNDLLARAVLAARMLGGASLAGIRVPYYPRAQDEEVYIGDPPHWTVGAQIFGAPSDPPTLYGQTRAAVLYLRNPAGEYDYTNWNLGDIPAFAERIQGPSVLSFDPVPETIPGIEWMAAPYDEDDGPVVFDDIADVDDAVSDDRNLPLLIRTLSADTDGIDPGTAVRGLWWALGSTALARPADAPTRPVLYSHTALFDGDPQLDLTSYWRRSGCGVVGGGNCDNWGGRSAEEEELVRSGQRECTTDGGASPCDTIGCNGRYYHCVVNARSYNIDFPSTFDGNRAFIARSGLTRADFLNGLELLCLAERNSSPDSNYGCNSPPPDVRSVVDLYRAEDFLRCKAARIREAAASAIVRDVPARVIEVLQRQGASGTFGDASGEYGAATDELAAAYVQLRDSEEALAATVSSISDQIDQLQNAIAASGVQEEIEHLQLASNVADRVTQCVVAAAGLVSASGAVSATNSTGVAGAAMAMAATCVNTGIQIGIAARVHDLRLTGLDIQNESAFITFDQQFSALSRQMSEQATAIQSSMLRISAAHTRLTTMREQGRRAVARALFLDADDTGRLHAVDTVMRRRYNTVLVRYRESHERAIRLAFIAKLALEQRLGMRLSTMNEDLLTVDAPQGWESTLCSLPSIDYDRVRGVMVEGGDGDSVAPPEDYAGSYVGDYVRRLEQVFEAYNVEWPFADGSDVAVISLRDDLTGTRLPCEVEVPNLLLQSNHLDVLANQDRPGWEVEGCVLEAPTEDNPSPMPACLRVTDTEVAVLRPAVTRYGPASAMRVEFGSADAADPINALLSENVRLSQRVNLPQGRYRLSWYEPTGPFGTWVRVRQVATDAIVYAHEAIQRDDHPPGASDGWSRLWYYFDVESEGEYAVTIERSWSMSPSYDYSEVAAMMLEDVSLTVRDDPAQSWSYGGGRILSYGTTRPRPPGPYFETGETRIRNLPVCVDATGSQFRRDAWTYGCVTVCPDGYDGTCAGSARERCFWQSSFTVSSDALQELTRTSAGFAAGNYNYRIESVGVNLVGTGLRDCERVGGGFDGCYASGNVAFSILHDGPYPVRNARGEIYDAPLFRGRIEGARALAAERYLSNPLSPADRSLIEPYTRRELSGRPLGGTFVLRLWDDDGLVFDRVEDVQLVLQYRYWQHQR